MSPGVTTKLAQSLAELIKCRQGFCTTPVAIIWHGGEPIACGINHFRALVEPFERLRQQGLIEHYVQTNATLINMQWCELFLKYKFHVGVSLDGPEVMNVNRVDWSGRPIYRSIVSGINALKKAGIAFTAIAVVSKENMHDPSGLYKFFSDLGCSSLGINIEENEGINRRDVRDDKSVIQFWRSLFEAWQQQPDIDVREFENVLTWMYGVIEDKIKESDLFVDDIFPSIAWNGDVVLLSPEFIGVDAPKYSNFTAGNILTDTLRKILNVAPTLTYVIDFYRGVAACMDTCQYFSYCRGGQASNKFFETGSTNATETIACRNRAQRLIDATLIALP
jgi:uncharacterized protein